MSTLVIEKKHTKSQGPRLPVGGPITKFVHKTPENIYVII